ncbi:MAG: helix-turn-helix domain-containing protein [Marinagarivorans sp.]|nr:helix-turn-helix domain-containing protein [Marinagarivorans sp.]
MDNTTPKRAKPKKPNSPVYSQRHLEIAAEAARNMGSKAEIAAAMGVSRRTLIRWREKYPALDQAIANAQMPSDAEAAAVLAALKERRQLAEDWILSVLQNRGEVLTTRHGDESGSFVETRQGLAPPRWLIERILGAGEAVEQKFEVNLNVAQPTDEYWDGDDFPDDDD